MSCDDKKCETECHGEAHKECGKLRLLYFNLRGRGELIRWILTLGHADWEDVRFSFDEWKNIKPTTPIGQVPVLECINDGKTHQLAQSGTIMRAAACWFGLAGKKPCEKVCADETLECIHEMAEAAGRAHFEQDPARKEKLVKELKEHTFPRILNYLEKKLHANGGKHIAGGEGFTHADLAVACFFDNLRLNNKHHIDAEECKTKYPGLHALAESVYELPEIKKWRAERPHTDM